LETPTQRSPSLVKIDGYSETRFFHKEALRLIHRPHMLADVSCVNGSLNPAPQPFKCSSMFAMPSFQISFLPVWRRQLILKHAFVAVERSGLAGLLCEVHLRE
jgi:hypothetical protein